MCRIFLVIALLLSQLTVPAGAQTAPYEGQMLRLAEILGAVHYLRNLCGEKGNAWRERMEQILEAENPEGTRRKRYIASFNRGYRSFAALHTTCTDSSIEAITHYMKEGEDLSREIVVKYGG